MKRIFCLVILTLFILISCEPSYNEMPQIISFDYIINDPDNDGAIIGGTSINFVCISADEEGDKVIYDWSCTGGTFSNTTTADVVWTSPVNNRTSDPIYEVFDIICSITDKKHPNKRNAAKVTIFTSPPR